MEFTLFSTHFTSDLLVFMGLIFFVGFTLGWFCRKGSIIWSFIGLMICIPVIEILMTVDVWFLTIPFVLGFLVHTGKPLYRRLTQG